MVDFRKRGIRAAAGLLGPGETVLAAAPVTPSPFVVGDAGLIAGAATSRAIGAAAGMARDRHREEHTDREAGVRALPAVACRPQVEAGVPRAGGLLAVTTDRVLLWRTSRLGTPRELVGSFSLLDVDEVAWQALGSGWMAGRPPSLLLWIGVAAGVLSAAAADLGSAGKHARTVVDALRDRRPGRVIEFGG